MFHKYGIFLLQIWPCIHRRSFHPSRLETIVFVSNNIWISWRKQLVQDYIIFIRNKTGIVVLKEKKNLTKLFKTYHNRLKRIKQARIWEWRPSSRVAPVLNKLNLARERRRASRAFADFTTASPWKVLLLKLPIICSEKRTVFRERSSRKTVNFEEQIMSKDKYSTRAYFSRQVEAPVFIILQTVFANA